MRIDFHRAFIKNLERLSPTLQEKVSVTLGVLGKNPHDPLLHNHALKGRMIGKRSLSVTGSIRIIFIEYDDYVAALLLNVGTHAQVYR